jgi:hypothetical protein
MIYVLIPTTKERREKLQKCLDAIRDSICTEPITTCIYENSDSGCVEAEHKLFSGFKDDTLAFILNDDMVVEPDCIQKLFDAYEWDYVLQPYENTNFGNLASSPFASIKTLRQYIHKDYLHNYNDRELTEVAKMLGIYKKVLDAKLVHEHFSTGATQIDQTYMKNRDSKEKDKQLYELRKSINFGYVK